MLPFHTFVRAAAALAAIVPAAAAAAQRPEIPVIRGAWWQVAGNPDLGPFTGANQQPVDFAIWQARDGTWQLCSCIRNTAIGGGTRLFHRWEGRNLTDADWQPMGIFLVADFAMLEVPGGLQAPHVFVHDDVYYMVYGDYWRICLLRSTDGKTFTRVLGRDGTPGLFYGPYGNTRDPMVLRLGNLFHCYYMGSSAGVQYQSAAFCRTSHDLVHWSEPIMVSAGGSAAPTNSFAAAECPFVLERNGLYYLFRNQLYGTAALNTQYASPNPLSFGVGDDFYRLGTLPVAAPEIVVHQGQYFIAALNPGLDGIRVARLQWQ